MYGAYVECEERAKVGRRIAFEASIGWPFDRMSQSESYLLALTEHERARTKGRSYPILSTETCTFLHRVLTQIAGLHGHDAVRHKTISLFYRLIDATVAVDTSLTRAHDVCCSFTDVLRVSLPFFHGPVELEHTLDRTPHLL